MFYKKPTRKTEIKYKEHKNRRIPYKQGEFIAFYLVLAMENGEIKSSEDQNKAIIWLANQYVSQFGIGKVINKFARATLFDFMTRYGINPYTKHGEKNREFLASFHQIDGDNNQINSQSTDVLTNKTDDVKQIEFPKNNFEEPQHSGLTENFFTPKWNDIHQSVENAQGVHHANIMPNFNSNYNHMSDEENQGLENSNNMPNFNSNYNQMYDEEKQGVDNSNFRPISYYNNQMIVEENQGVEHSNIMPNSNNNHDQLFGEDNQGVEHSNIFEQNYDDDTSYYQVSSSYQNEILESASYGFNYPSH